MTDEYGITEGDVCNRKGCKGIIEQVETDTVCSCHINPPCSHCEYMEFHCPECGWESNNRDEKAEHKPKSKPMRVYKPKTLKDLDNTKVDYISESHTHFSMKKKGVYPPRWDNSKAIKEILPKVRGTFGGRFESLGAGKFVYIAYTD